MKEEGPARKLPAVGSSMLRLEQQGIAEGISHHASRAREPVASPENLLSSGDQANRRPSGSASAPQAPPARPQVVTLGQLRREFAEPDSLEEANEFDPSTFLLERGGTPVDRSGSALAGRALGRMFGKR